MKDPRAMGMQGIAAKVFRASAQMKLAEPGLVIRCLCERFGEYGQVSLHDGKALIETGFGLATLEEAGAMLTLSAQSADETGLAYVKLSMAEHLLSLEACRGCPRLVWQGDAATGLVLPYFREMRLAGARSLAPGMRRVTLRGENLARFAQAGPGGGLHVRLLFPLHGAAPCWPVTGADGRPQWPAGAGRPLARIYTVRRIDVHRGEVDIEMVLHTGATHGPGAYFAAHARPGAVVGMTGPGGGAVEAVGRTLLAGDGTALPAIARILETLPASAAVSALIEVADEREEQALSSPANLDLRWLHRGTREPGTTTLLEDAVRACPWAADAGTYVWAGCEASGFRAIRVYLRGEKQRSRGDHLVAAYWRRGFAGDEARKTE